MALEISDYALIGDCETAALVGRDGSIDWLCWPRFDDNACFTKLLGGGEHGCWRIAPEHGIRSTRRRYREGTLILETEFDVDAGVVRIVDFMPIRKDSHRSEIVRIVEGVSGDVPLRMDLRIRFDYGRIVPWVTRENGGRRLRAVAGPHSVTLETPATGCPSCSPTRPRTCRPRGRRLRRRDRRDRARLAGVVRPVPLRGAVARGRHALADHHQGAHLRPHRRHRRGADHLAAGRSAASATGTTASAGCATPPSRFCRF
jgi:hypothetical protein